MGSGDGKPSQRRSGSSGSQKRKPSDAKTSGASARKPSRKRSSGSGSRSRSGASRAAGSVDAGKRKSRSSRSKDASRAGEEQQPKRTRTRRRRRPARSSQKDEGRAVKAKTRSRSDGGEKKTAEDSKPVRRRRRPRGKSEGERRGGEASQARRRSPPRKKRPARSGSSDGKASDQNKGTGSESESKAKSGEKRRRRRSRPRRRSGAKKPVAATAQTAEGKSGQEQEGSSKRGSASKSKSDSSEGRSSGRRRSRGRGRGKGSSQEKKTGGGRSRSRGRGRGRKSDGSAKKPAAQKKARSRKRTESERPVVVRKILINAIEPQEIRIGVLEDGRLDQLYYERAAEKKYLGNIYKGRVVNVEPSIQAAFVDVGIGRNGFLHVSDVLGIYKDSTVVPVDRLSERVPGSRDMKMQDILRKGQDILVQISKDSIGLKGPSLTTYVSLPGKYLVLMPGVSRHGVSKRIRDGSERSALRKKLANLDPPKGMGYIVRTAGEEETAELLKKDFDGLMSSWTDIVEKVRTRRTPTLLFQESDLVTRSLRDLFDSSVEEILIDEAAVYEHGKDFLLGVMPQAAERLKHYTGKTPLFTKFGIEQQIERIYNRRIQLPSGGWIILEQTEALVSVDVNSGKYRDEEDLESTALKTNLEAAEVICQELRLRDLGGLVVIDFIDMEKMPNRRELEQAVKKYLSRDKAKSWITRVSRFGIIEMTRQRVRPSFESSNHVACSCCEGTGWVKSPTSAGIEILRRLRGELGQRQKKTCEITTGPDVTKYLCTDRGELLANFEKDYNKKIVVKNDPKLGSDKYTIRYK
ncbi:MAG: Rne/Rng family ribonuclease [Planctomycetes bacterium]|nr:Rne/Rng family ribonuclease [Planctomycetota bacterium]